MFRSLILFCCLSLVSLSANAQCEKCPAQGAEDQSFCYNDADLFGSRCATFTEGVKTFKISLGKKSYILPMPAADMSTLNYLLSLTANKQYKKLKGTDVLFLQEAITAWNSAKMDLGYELTDTGLGLKIIKQGDGPKPKTGQTVAVHYAGYLKDGSKFDSSFDRGTPIEFPLGQGRVIKGWDQGIAMLNVGTRAWLRIPPELGYGSRGAGGAIPPNATLYFEVELVEIK
ncbi:MAG: FKBP-type peptidyl-prolyl cis-trans isomerase [Bacteroidota bacterium]